MKTQLEGAGLEYERAEAVDGKMLTPEELKKDVTPLGRWLITRGMVGCFLSHRNCWQRCVDAAAGPILGERTPAPHPCAHSAASHAQPPPRFFFGRPCNSPRGHARLPAQSSRTMSSSPTTSPSPSPRRSPSCPMTGTCFCSALSAQCTQRTMASTWATRCSRPAAASRAAPARPSARAGRRLSLVHI